MRDKDIALLNKLHDESQAMFKTMHSFLVSQGFMSEEKTRPKTPPEANAKPTPIQHLLTKKDVKEFVASQLQLAGTNLAPAKEDRETVSTRV